MFFGLAERTSAFCFFPGSPTTSAVAVRCVVRGVCFSSWTLSTSTLVVLGAVRSTCLFRVCGLETFCCNAFSRPRPSCRVLRRCLAPPSRVSAPLLHTPLHVTSFVWSVCRRLRLHQRPFPEALRFRTCVCEVFFPVPGVCYCQLWRCWW